MLGVSDDEVTGDEAVVVLFELTTLDDTEEDEASDVATEVLNPDVAGKDDPCKAVLEVVEVLEPLETLEVLEVLMLEVGLIVVVGSGEDDTTTVETEPALVVTIVERDELGETVVETTVDDVLIGAQSVDTQ